MRLHPFYFYQAKRGNFLGTNNNRLTLKCFFVLRITLLCLIMGLLFFFFFNLLICSTFMLQKRLIKLILLVPNKYHSKTLGIICAENTCMKSAKSHIETRSHTGIFETINKKILN